MQQQGGIQMEQSGLKDCWTQPGSRSKDIFTKKGEIVELQEARANHFFVVQNIKKNQVCVRHTK